MTFLPAQIQGRWFYLYLILDLYSRKIVGFEVHDTDSADHAGHLARRTALAEGIHAMPRRPVLHGDNGATLKTATVLAMSHWLGITNPAYRFDWNTCFPAPTWQPLAAARSAGDGGAELPGATRSSASIARMASTGPSPQ